MITNLNVIVKEWAYRVHDGKPDPNNSAHLYQLSEILIENKWPLSVIDVLLQNLKEGDEWWTTLSPEQQAQYIKDHPKSQKAQDAKEKEDGEEPKEKPKKEKPSEKIKRRKEVNIKADKLIKNSKNPAKTAYELILARRDDIRNAYDLPAGTPASTTGETYGGIALEQLVQNPNMTEDEFVENELEKMKGTPLHEKLLEEAKQSKDWQKDPEEYVKTWLKVGYRTGKGELEYLESEPKFKYKKPQSKPYPISTIMDYNQKQIVQSLLETKRDEHKPGSEEYEHYQTQLDYLEKLDDTDTGIVYETNDEPPRIGFKHTSNKKKWKDPHNNTSVRKKGEKISKAVEGNKDLSDGDRKKVVETTTNAVERAATTVDNAEKVVGQDSQNLSKQATKNIGSLLGVLGRTPKERSKDYVEEMRQNAAMKKHLVAKGIDPKKATEQEIAEAVVEMAKDGTATQDIQKIMLKASDLVSRVRDLAKNGLAKNKYKPMSVNEIVKHLNDKGQNITAAQVNACLDSELDDIEDTSRKRKDSMAVAHEQLVGDLQKADSEMDPDSYPINLDGDNGPNQRGYVQSFLDEIHFTRYINGELEGIQSINIGGTSVSPTEFRECLSELSGYDGDLDSEEGRKGLLEHLQKRVRVSPDSSSISFGHSGSGKSKELGKEQYRTKGKSKSILAHLGDDMIDCLKGKNK
tara:strand:+ start:63 stop:2129 length:2067 start_codon:yes stop_codon:yes gene_type:complete